MYQAPSRSSDLQIQATQQTTATQVLPAPASASRSTLTPQAPGSGTLSRLSIPASTYELLPTRASTSRVASAASAAFLTAACTSDGFSLNVSVNAASGSTSVRDGGRARVYVYSFSRAAETARDQSCTVTTPAEEAASAWARAEKKILVVPHRYSGRRASVEGELTSTVRRWCHPSFLQPLQTQR